MSLGFNFSTVTTLLISSGLFLFGVCVMPVQKRVVTLDLRLYVGLFASLVYVLASSLLWALGDVGTWYWVGLTGFLLVLPLLAYVISLLVYMSMSKIDHSYFFALWYSGTLGACLAFKAYALLGGVLLFGVLLWLGLRLMDYFQLVSTMRTLVVSASSYDALLDVQRMLKTFRAQVVSSDITRGEDYVLTCSYRLAAVAHHIFSRYMFKSSRFTAISIYDA